MNIETRKRVIADEKVFFNMINGFELALTLKVLIIGSVTLNKIIKLHNNCESTVVAHSKV